MNNHKYILSIAGFDPSSGAGITSDIKTFEAHGLYGLSVCTAVTIQNDIDFKSSHWIAIDVIIEQIETLFERFKIDVVKIGIVENWKNLSIITTKLHQLNSEIKIVLDPVVKATAGFDFHATESLAYLDTVLTQCFIITPNYDEIKALYPNKSIDETIEYISNKTNLYLKGGHRLDKKGWDELYHNKIVQTNIPPIAKTIKEKHGSGCVLSSSLASNIALELPIEDAAFQSKTYIETYLNSDESLLGTHAYNLNSKNTNYDS